MSYATILQSIIRVYIFCLAPASVAQLDARPTGDQEVTGSTSTGLATVFCED